MPERPRAVAFDVLQTLFSLEPLRARLQAAGLKPEALELWFAKTLRDGFALAAADSYRPFREVASATLEVLLSDQGQPPDPAEIDGVLQGFAELPPEPDVPPAFARLREQGVRILALTNGSSDTTRAALRKAGLEHHVEQVLSIEDVKRWKPRREVYLHAAQVAGVRPADLALVAAHAWDVHGAKRAGLIAGWVRRQEGRFSPAMEPPDVRGETLVEVCDALLALPGSGSPGKV